ncbi:hypothetical protein [Virgibacillus halodenitrificans]|uniref:hypothetical protein n=1 Tax=Virgibacillus halodenitrificans TaxID=1482 RepID=UPI000A698331|nr:hypothetical protein [Virgibacillus halodenitrificans]
MRIEKVIFEKGKMMKLIKKDLLLQRMYKDLGKNDLALEILFNSEVLGDCIMENEYLYS